MNNTQPVITAYEEVLSVKAIRPGARGRSHQRQKHQFPYNPKKVILILAISTYMTSTHTIDSRI
jgi:hypothetical protein